MKNSSLLSTYFLSSTLWSIVAAVDKERDAVYLGSLAWYSSYAAADGLITTNGEPFEIQPYINYIYPVRLQWIKLVITMHCNYAHGLLYYYAYSCTWLIKGLFTHMTGPGVHSVVIGRLKMRLWVIIYHGRFEYLCIQYVCSPPFHTKGLAWLLTEHSG